MKSIYLFMTHYLWGKTYGTIRNKWSMAKAEASDPMEIAMLPHYVRNPFIKGAKIMSHVGHRAAISRKSVFDAMPDQDKIMRQPK